MPYISATTSHVRIGTPLRRRARWPRSQWLAQKLTMAKGNYRRIPGNVEKLSHLLEDEMLGAAGLFLPVSGFRIQRNALRL